VNSLSLWQVAELEQQPTARQAWSTPHRAMPPHSSPTASLQPPGTLLEAPGRCAGAGAGCRFPGTAVGCERLAPLEVAGGDALLMRRAGTDVVPVPMLVPVLARPALVALCLGGLGDSPAPPPTDAPPLGGLATTT
jgi:hypothetical protein